MDCYGKYSDLLPNAQLERRLPSDGNFGLNTTMVEQGGVNWLDRFCFIN